MTDSNSGQPFLQYVPITQIEVDPNQPRREMEAPDEVNEARTLEGLASSIRQYGILQPIRVRQLGLERYQIISGERRFKAAGIAHLTLIPVMVVETDGDVLLAQLTENVQRKAMTPLEMADAIHHLIQSGLSGKMIAERLGLNPTQVSILTKLQTVSPLVREALEERLITSPRAAYDLSKLSRTQQRALISQAREKQQIIGQQEVKTARHTLAQAETIEPFSPPIMAKTEVAALLEILNQPVDGEKYDASSDRQTILGILPTTPYHQESLPTPSPNLSEIGKDSATFHAEVAIAAVDEESNETTDETTLLQHESLWKPRFKTIPTDDQDFEIAVDYYLTPIRVPAFTLQVEEFVNLAKQLGEEPPAGLADPGGWLVDFLKRKSRQH
jgi:ParB family chromosome partitioning protein